MASGAIVQFKTNVSSIDFEAPSLTLGNGSTISTDLIIAADGKNSFIRRTMHPGSEQEITDAYVFQVNIPREAMVAEDYTKAYYEDPATRIYPGPGQWAFISPAPNQEIYDMQIVSRDFASSGRDPNPDVLLEPLKDLRMLGDSIDKWSPEFRRVIAKGKTFFKWHIALTPDVPTGLSKSGKVILIGDAYHGIDPSAGFGTALCLEDGVTIAAFLRKATSPADLPALLSIFDKVMTERAHAVGGHSVFMGALLGLPDGKMQARRDKVMAKWDPNSNLTATPNVRAKPGTAEWQAYLDDYDPEAAAEAALRKYQRSERLEPGSVPSRL